MDNYDKIDCGWCVDDKNCRMIFVKRKNSDSRMSVMKIIGADFATYPSFSGTILVYFSRQ